MKQIDRKTMLGQAPLLRLLIQLSLPAMTGMLVMASYNVVDTLFVGWGIGPKGIAAGAAAFPIQFFINGFAMLIAVGTASLSSRSLGAGNQEAAERALGNGFILAIITGLGVATVAQVILPQLIALLGASEELRPLVTTYLRIIFYGAPFAIVAMLFNNTIRAEGNTRYAMCSLIIPAVLNSILDPLFIFVFRMGIAGAAWATVISQFTMLLWNINYYRTKRYSLIALTRTAMKLKWTVAREIFSIGFSEFTRISALSISLGLLMNQFSHYGDTSHIAAYGLISRVASLAVMPIFGIGQGLQPILGYCYGAGLYQRARKATEIALISALTITFSAEAISLVGAQVIVRSFSNDEAFIAIAVGALRISMLGFGCIGLQIIGTIIFQALGFVGPALFLSLSRQIIFFIPFMLLLPRFFGVNGLFLTYPLSDILSSFVTLAFLIKYRSFFRSLEHPSRSASLKSEPLL